jgi:predicted DNA-binding protein with PD1-like motif
LRRGLKLEETEIEIGAKPVKVGKSIAMSVGPLTGVKVTSRLLNSEGMMRMRLLNEHGEKTFATVFEKGEEFMAGMLDFAKQQTLDAASFTAIGAFSSVTLGFFDRERMDYKKIPVDDQVEVLSLVGNITMGKGKPKIHAHVVLGKSDGAALGGHILEAHVWPTLEVIVVESPARLRRTTDEETGLALIEL